MFTTMDGKDACGVLSAQAFEFKIPLLSLLTSPRDLTAAGPNSCASSSFRLISDTNLL